MNRSPDPSSFPTAPPRPLILNTTESTITVTWNDPMYDDTGIIGYTVEHWSADLQAGWVIAVHRIPAKTVTIGELKPETEYVFLVRAENIHGLSPPSELSKTVRTLALDARTITPGELDAARYILNVNKIVLTEAFAVNSTAVQLRWVCNDHQYIEGYYIRFRDLSGGSNFQKYNLLTVMNLKGAYVVNNLRKYTKYEFFVTPFYKSVEGRPSNTKVSETMEDIPTGPPDLIHAGLLNSTAGWIKWSPPLPQHHNGVLKGYKVQVMSRLPSKMFVQMTVNASTTYVIVNNLTIGLVYLVKVSAFTSIGVGPFSEPVVMLLEGGPHARPSESKDTQIIHQPWFVAVLGAMLVGVTSISAAVIILQRRGKRLNTALTSVGNNLSRGPKDSALWIDEGWRPVVGANNQGDEKHIQQVEYCEVDKRPSVSPSPYATTMLIGNMPGPDLASLLPPPPEHPPPPTPLSQRSMILQMHPPLPPQRTASSQGFTGKFSFNPNQEYISAPCSQNSSMQRSVRPSRAKVLNKKCVIQNECDSDTENEYSVTATNHFNNWTRKTQCDSVNSDYRRERSDYFCEEERNSCSSCQDTCCSCSETTSCLYSEAIMPSTGVIQVPQGAQMGSTTHMGYQSTNGR